MYKNLIVYGAVVLLSICSVAMQAASNDPRSSGAAEACDG
jgi:hypothetical protein